MKRLFTITLILFMRLSVHAQTLTVSTDRESGVYHATETITWTLHVEGSADIARYEVLQNGAKSIQSGTVNFENGVAQVSTAAGEPRTLLFRANLASADAKAPRSYAGAVVDADKITPSLPPPSDFEEFWKGKLTELQAVPINAQLEEKPSDDPEVEYALVRLDNIRGTHVYGQLARPKKAGKYPALLIVQWAGVYPLKRDTVITRAKQGFIVLNISAHDQPSNESEEFYKKLSETTLKDYVSIGQTDRETSYFLRMYLGCYRAADYLTSLDGWDGKTLVAFGTSQGGLQALVTGSIFPKVTAVIANVPAGCDVTGFVKDRAIGWPYWHGRAKGDDAEKITNTSRYFDAMHFTPQIHAPSLVSCGLIDLTCPPSGVLAAANQIQGKKEILIMPRSDHQGQNNSQAVFYQRAEAWLKAIASGKTVPPTEK